MIAAFIIVWYILASLGLILFCSMQVKASAYYNTDYFPMQQNENGLIPDTLMTYMESYLDSENNYIFIAPWGNGYYWYAYSPKSDGEIYAEIYSSCFQFKLYTSSTNAHGGYIAWWYDENAGIWDSGFNYINNGNPFNSSIYDSSMSYVSNFRIYTNNVDNEVVLRYGSEEVVPDVGHAVHPHFDGLHPHYGNTVTPPDEVPPTYTINNYSWTTYNNPPVDNSSTDALLESIFDILSYNAGYLQTNISNEFDNLITNLKGLVDYLGATLQYYGDLIIDNIQNGIQNLYDNMEALVQPIYEKVAELTDLVTNPFDSEEFEDQLNDSTFYSSLDTTITSISTFGTSLTHATEPESLTLALNLTSIGWGVAEIDFNWIKPFRNIIRVIIGCVLIYWLAIEVITGLNNIIGSGGDNEE